MSRATRAGRAGWHARTAALVGAWLAAAVVASLAHRALPSSRWLLVHLLLLGAVSTAVLVWSSHFAAALLRTPGGRGGADGLAGTGRRAETARLAAFTLGAVAVVAGVAIGASAPVLLGGATVAGVGAWHAASLLRRMRRALPSRFGATVRYHVTAAALLPVGVALGVLLARGALDDEAAARVVLAHALVGLLGWIGLTVLGTLVTLWPTMLRTRVVEGAERAARRALPVLAGAVLLAAGSALAGSRPLAALGVAAYLAGLGVAARPLVGEGRQRPPTGFATWSVLAGVAWLAGCLAVLAVALATAPDWTSAAGRAGELTAPAAVGFVAQVLLGALTYLLPAVLGGGPLVARARAAVLERGAAARVAVTNAGLLLCALPVPSLVRVVVSVVVLGALAAFLPLAVRAALVRRAPATDRPTGVPTEAPTPQRHLGRAGAGLAVLVLAVALGVAADPAALGLATGPDAAAGVRPTGDTTTVRLEARGMRFTPGTVTVPAGDRLVVELVNRDEDRHDLVLETGARTERLAPGDAARLDAGVVGRDLEGWCSVAGHRQMGMVLAIRVTGAPGGAETSTAGADGPTAVHSAAGPGSHGPDLLAEPGPDFTARDPRLAAALPGPARRVHRRTLTVREVAAEVSPGVRQTRWTYDGTAPGPTLRGRVGDLFEITLVNDGSIGHSVDFHAGALAPDRPMRTIQPGERLTYRFTATRSGIWLYHCSTVPLSLHVANGMFGAVVIDPPGLPPVDREYLLVSSEVHLGGPEGADPDAVAADRPDLVVFNGVARQYAARPLTARVDERVRFWVLAAGPSRGVAFHVVGGQFDTTYAEGAYLLRAATGGSGGSQVLDLAPAQGGFVELTFPEAGRYPLVSHRLVDAERGAHGYVDVTR